MQHNEDPLECVWCVCSNHIYEKDVWCIPLPFTCHVFGLILVRVHLTCLSATFATVSNAVIFQTTGWYPHRHYCCMDPSVTLLLLCHIIWQRWWQTLMHPVPYWHGKKAGPMVLVLYRNDDYNCAPLHAFNSSDSRVEVDLIMTM